MKKSAASKPAWSTPRFAGQTFLFAGKASPYDVNVGRLTKRIEAEGGTVVTKVARGLSYVVNISTRGTPAGAHEAAALNKKGAAIGLVDLAGLMSMLAVSPEDARAMLRAGKKGLERWRSLRPERVEDPIDLAGVDLSGCDLREIHLAGVVLDGADLHGADLRKSELSACTRVNFDGANMRNTVVADNNKDCSFRNVDAVDASMPANFERCDFQGANCQKASFHLARFKDCNLDGVDLTGGNLGYAENEGHSTFQGANFTEVKLSEADLTGADFAGADFAKADLTNCKMLKTNLSRANFRNATLKDVDFTGATADGADFTGADVTGAKFGDIDPAKCKGLNLAASQEIAGPKLAELASASRQCKKLFLHADIDVPEGCMAVDITAWPNGAASADYITFVPGKTKRDWNVDGNTLVECVLRAARKCKHGTLRLDEFRVTAKGCKLGPNEIRALVVDAWCEAMGSDRVKLAAAQEKSLTAHRDAWLARWRSGPAGVKAWNGTDSIDRWRTGSFAGVDLSGAGLEKLECIALILEGAKFAGAKLQKSLFERCDCRNADFSGANLREAKFDGSKANSANFAGAKLVKASLCEVMLANASLVNADLTGADLGRSDLCGANMQGAKLDGASFSAAQFDERTQWPEGFKIPPGAKWKGKGVRPSQAGVAVPAVKRVSAREQIDFDEFMKRLPKLVDQTKLAKSLKMLKTERFQLFDLVTEEDMSGVVKSQTDKDLIYCCRLSADGSYSCCTQNLNVCGGLRGGLCKHLLVMIVGLTKAGRMTPGLAHALVRASRERYPELNKETASGILLRYKGAEAGEVDWRPTETVPEDYYTL